MKKNLNQHLTYRLFNKSKKFSLKWSSYFQVYENIFSEYRNKKITFVEIGVANGGSLFIWKKFFGKNAKIIGAGPFMVIETEVFEEQRLKPEYSFFISSNVAIETPEFPIFPHISGRTSGSAP